MQNPSPFVQKVFQNVSNRTISIEKCPDYIFADIVDATMPNNSNLFFCKQKDCRTCSKECFSLGLSEFKWPNKQEEYFVLREASHIDFVHEKCHMDLLPETPTPPPLKTSRCFFDNLPRRL